MQKTRLQNREFFSWKKNKSAQHTEEMNLNIVKVIYMPNSQLTSYSMIKGGKFFSKMRNKTREATFPITIQHDTRNPSQMNQRG